MSAHRGWLAALKGASDIVIQHCRNSSARELKIIAAILESPAIDKILSHLDLDPEPLPKTERDPRHSFAF